MTFKPKKLDLAAEWREARLLHPLYSALGRELSSNCPLAPTWNPALKTRRRSRSSKPGSGFSKWTRRYRSINCANSFRLQV